MGKIIELYRIFRLWEEEKLEEFQNFARSVKKKLSIEQIKIIKEHRCYMLS